MAKTRSKSRNIAIKKGEEEEEEEEEEDCRSTLLLHSVSNTRNNNRITKREPPTVKNNLPAPEIKVEEDTDTKSLLQPSPKHSKLPKGQLISQEQINLLIDNVANHGMNVAKAARTAKISRPTARYYYNVYKNDPDKKIPLPRNRYLQSKTNYTQEHIENLMRYITNDKLNVKEAARKANMCCHAGYYYYKKYLQDPDHAIPIPHSKQRCIQGQRNALIGYIVNDKMSLRAASKKSKMSLKTGSKYYHEYFKDQHPDIPTPSHIVSSRERYTQNQIKELIGYIVNDKMSIRAASKKANINHGAGYKHYQKYLRDHDVESPVSIHDKRYKQDRINELIGYIVNNNMTLKAASKKANISYKTGKKYLEEIKCDAST